VYQIAHCISGHRSDFCVGLNITLCFVTFFYMLKSEGNYFYIIMDFWYFSCQNSGNNFQDAILQCRRSDFILESSIIEPLLRGHLSYKATFSLSERWPPNTGLTVYELQ
jgi:hypothetical protein